MTVKHILSSLIQVISSQRVLPGGSTLNPSDKGANVTLSGGNLTATNSSGVYAVRGTSSKSTGKKYFEITIGSGAGGNSLSVGIANASAPLNTTGLGLDSGSDSIVWYDASAIYINDGSIGSPGDFSNGQVLGVAVDLGGTKIWFCDISGAPTNWNGLSTNTPGVNGGASFSASTGPWFAALGFRNAGAMTINFGGSGFSGSIPSGFSAWG